MCALQNHILLFNQHSVIYLLASQMNSVIYLIINNKQLSYHRNSVGQAIERPYATCY